MLSWQITGQRGDVAYDHVVLPLAGAYQLPGSSFLDLETGIAGALRHRALERRALAVTDEGIDAQREDVRIVL